MTKEEKIAILVEHFNKYDLNYFITNINIDGIDYAKFFNCLLKPDIISIYNNITKDISPASTIVASKSTLNKTDYVLVLNKHFNSKDITYFLDKISLNTSINYKQYLKCLSNNNINAIYNNVKQHLESNGPAKTNNPIGTNGPAKTNSPIGTNGPAKINSPIGTNGPVKTNNPIGTNLDFLPFTTTRTTKDLNTEITRIKSYRLNSKKQQAIMQLSQLFENERITLRSNYYDYILEIIIINELSLRDDTLLYIGKVLNDPPTTNIPTLKDKNVVVKVQPRTPHGIKSTIAFQITTEQVTMLQLQRNCKDIFIPKSYGYGLLEPLKQGDIQRYVLVSELLGRDLSKTLKHTTVANIKSKIIDALRSLQKMHKCNFIHLDIKHENIVFSDPTEKQVKIIDFGLAENIYDRHNKRNLLPRKPGEGSPLYMATMQHYESVKDFMDDLQAFAWMLLDLLGDKPIIIGMPWYGSYLKKIYIDKNYFIENYKNHNDAFIANILNGTLNKNNINVIGEIAEYTINRADKSTKYNTDLKTSTGLYFTEYNEQYYTDIASIINKLS